MAFLINFNLYLGSIKMSILGKKFGRCLKANRQILEHNRQKPNTYLMYVENGSKKHPGSLKGRKTKLKIVYHYIPIFTSHRDFLRLHKLYSSRCPADHPDHAYYL